MTRKNDPGARPPDGPPPERLSLEESRYLDGELSAQEARAMEHRLAANPAQAARLEAWRDGMDHWRDDAHRAGSLDPDALVDAILHPGNLHPGNLHGAEPTLSNAGPNALGRERWAVSPYAGRWYAAAAALLMAVGVGGTLLARHDLSRPYGDGNVHSQAHSQAYSQAHSQGADSPAQRPHVAAFEYGLLDKMAEGPELAPRLVIARADATKTYSPTGGEGR